MDRRNISRDLTELFVAVSALPSGLYVIGVRRRKSWSKCLEGNVLYVGIKDMREHSIFITRIPKINHSR
jgi:hypothetical protein